MRNSMTNNYRIFLSTCSILKRCPSVSLLGLLAATASFAFSLRLTPGRPFQKHSVLAMFQTFSGCYPLISCLDRSYQLSSVRGLKSASSPATVIVEMLWAFLKCSNHPLEATKPSTCNFSALLEHCPSDWNIGGPAKTISLSNRLVDVCIPSRSLPFKPLSLVVSCSLYSSNKPTETLSNIRKQHSPRRLILQANQSRACHTLRRLHHDHVDLCPCQTYQPKGLFAYKISKCSWQKMEST